MTAGCVWYGYQQPTPTKPEPKPPVRVFVETRKGVVEIK